MTPKISIAATTGLLDVITDAGGNLDQILHELGLERSVLTNPEGFISASIFARFLELASQATADDCLGLHFGERYNPKNIGPVIYVTLNSPTIGAAFENVERYLTLHNEAAKWFTTIDGERAYLRYELVDLGIETPRQFHEASMAVALTTLRMMAGSHWAPQEIHFTHESPLRTSEHARLFAAPARFGCETNAFVVDREFLERQVPAADPRLYKILRRYLDRVLSEMPREDNFLASMRKAIAEEMRDGDPKLARVAKQLATSPRTLQRRIKEHGFNYKQLTDDTRRRFAMKYLKDRNHTLTQIAFLLGYSEVSAFNRAFKRWTGSTPLKYRKESRP